ncbi:MAG: signal peptidase II, partial [Candidatus Firestonebacteria bacterium]|nr:signal peptidase II [Candidatus Firestonebacteria bacterium]
LRIWPVFNVADIAICIGMGLMLLEIFLDNKRHKKTNTCQDKVFEDKETIEG